MIRGLQLCGRDTVRINSKPDKICLHARPQESPSLPIEAAVLRIRYPTRCTACPSDPIRNGAVIFCRRSFPGNNQWLRLKLDRRPDWTRHDPTGRVMSDRATIPDRHRGRWDMPFPRGPSTPWPDPVILMGLQSVRALTSPGEQPP